MKYFRFLIGVSNFNKEFNNIYNNKFLASEIIQLI